MPGEELRRGAIFTVRLLTAEQVAEITGESKKTVWKRVARGELPHLKIGRLDRFSLEEINAWLEQMGPKPGTQKTGVFPGIKDMRELTPSQTREDYHG
ncbi:MAG: helix-turn-helix domain-containing protein [candidate division WOR-3 bacterium]